MEDSLREFHIEEFRQLKSEIAALLLRIGSLFRYSMLSSTLIYSWLLTTITGLSNDGICLKISAEFAMYAAFIPPLYVGTSFILARYTYLHIKTVAAYLRRVESFLGILELGWEKYWSEGKPTLTNFFLSVWLWLLAGCFLVSIRLSVSFYHLETCKVLMVTPSP